MWTAIAQHISAALGKSFQPSSQRSVGGGCINQGYQLADEHHTYFVKLNRAELVSMFESEALGLQQIQATKTIRVPTPVCWGVADGRSYIVLEWLDLGRGSSDAWAAMGQQLAMLHRVSGEQFKGGGYGWDRNNTIGSTPQINTWTADWATFFRDHRLGYQFQLAQRRGGYFPKYQQLLEAVPELLADHYPLPSLLHGDLWSGNAAITRDGEPTIFDPATYRGDREADLAMTELFGGFPAAFYQGYNRVFPLEPGYRQRKTLYNLYHILNHFNLFGGGYESQANQMIAQLLRG
ncbi:MAG: fructosamine kinase family protein [Cyanobacteriota bacterium SKYGB_h_bin112]|nr:fructosamine kinase family protein [Cyanobacteriota bacterium SKYGB_h_bin112]